MYAGNMEMPCTRTARHLMIPHTYLPYDVTEDDLFEVLGAYGIYDIALNEWGADVYFDSVRGASEAEKRWIIEAFGPEMVGGPIVNGSNMGHMGPMPPMSGMRPMGGMAPGASRAWGARPVPTHQPRLNQHGPSSNMRVSTSVDGSRTFQPIPTPIDMAASANSQDENTLMTGPCSLCQKCTSYLCGRCGIFYCSRECQKQSWPTHQTECNSKLPPLNFAGKRNVTEIEINSDQQQLQGRQSPQRHEQRSPTGKQSSTWRSRSNADTSQDNHSPKPQQSGSPAVKDESPQSSSFGRSNIRPGGFERRNEPRDENRRGEGYRQANGQGNGFGARQGQSNAQGRNFNRNRSDDGNGDRNRTYASKPSSGGDGDRGRTNASKPPSGDETSPRGLPSRAQDIPVATNVSPSTGQNGKSPTKRESTMALLMKNMKLSSPGVETCSEPTGPAAPAPQVTSPIDAYFKPDCINILKGSEVLITHVDENAVYLQAKGNINQLALLTKKLADHCALGKVLQRQPKKKEFVAAKFSADGNFYRAVVQSRVKNDLKELYVVQFVDFGNPESGLTNSDMMYLTKEIAEVPCMAVKVALKDVSEFSGEARSILSKYLADETILDFVDYGNDLAAGVTLFEKSGESVNVKLLKAMGKLKTSPAREPAKSPLAAMLAAAAPAAAAPATAAPATAAPATAAPAAAAPAPAPAAAAPVVAEVAKATLASKLLAVAAAAAPAPAVAPAPVPVVAVPAEAPVVAVSAEAPVAAPAPVVAAAPVAAAAPAPVAAAAPAPVVAAAPAPVAAAAPLQQRKFTLGKDLKYVPFPSVGTTCSVLINFFHKEAGFFSACPLDLAALESVDTISTIITSHVANTPPYRPDEDELCVAKWSADNTFYRAVCFARDVDDTYQVMFLEYGNTDTVPHADIRPYSEALAAFPALSSMCTLSDPPQLNELQKSKVQEMFKENWTVQAVVVKIDDGACILDIPEIRIALP